VFKFLIATGNQTMLPNFKQTARQSDSKRQQAMDMPLTNRQTLLFFKPLKYWRF
jgi:hypothetical protein